MAVEVVAHLELVNFEQDVWNLRWHYHSVIKAKNFKGQGHLLIHGDICIKVIGYISDSDVPISSFGFRKGSLCYLKTKPKRSFSEI